MGCSNARLLVQAPLTGEGGASMGNPTATSPSTNTTFAADSSTRMHLTGVDLVVERNGSYTLLLTPKTHKQLMPYVLRKKRFRILVDKPRSDPTLTSNEPILMENKKDSTKKGKSIEEIASDEYERVQARFVGGRSIDRGNPEDEDELIQSDDEGMIEEIVTTVEQDKDLECKVKKKIETKKTIAQHPQTHNTITKVVKTEVTEITRTITINDHHDLERAKRELGIDDVNRLLPSSTWIDYPKRYETSHDVSTSKGTITKQQVHHPDEKPLLAQSTVVGRGPVVETISPVEVKSSIESKKKPKTKKKKSKFCSCTRAANDDDDEKDKQPSIAIPVEQATKKSSVAVISTAPIKSVVETQIQGQALISSDLKDLIIEKKLLLIEYIHSKIFTPTNLFTSIEEDMKGRKISSRILDLLRYDRCSSWKQMSEQLTEEYAGNSIANRVLQPMINTYENLFTTKQANLFNTFATIHHENDIRDIQQNHAYLNIAQTHIHHQSSPIVETIPETVQVEQVHSTNDDDEQLKKDVDITEQTPDMQPIYNEEYLTKLLANISSHKPITLAEAIAYDDLDIEDPKLGLSIDLIQSMKHLFRPSSDSNVSNAIRIKRSGEYLTDLDLSQTNPFEQLTNTEPWIYRLQSTFEPTLDFNEKQFRILTETLTQNKDQYDQLEFDITRTSLPIYDLKESSTNDFSQSDSGYSMTTATHESLASKIKIEFEPINQDIESVALKQEDFDEDEKIDLDKATQEQLDKYELNHELIQIIKSDFNGTDKTIGQAILSRELRLNTTNPDEIEHLKSLGIGEEQIRILTAFFFPKQTRIIAYSPEPGRFVEAQTTYNPDYPGYKTDTTIIQIQEKQLSSDQLAMQRNLHEDRPVQLVSPEPEPKQIVPTTVTQAKPPAIVSVKKRKSTSSGGLLSCFKSKKPKSGTEQQGQPTIVVTQAATTQESGKSTEDKPTVDYSILPDGRRIYIDAFRDRPGLNMSYRPDDFDNRFVLPTAKPASEYERPVTPEVGIKTIPIDESVSVHVEETSEIQLSTTVEHKPEIHLEPRPATIEPVDVQPESTVTVVVPSTKSEIKVTEKKSLTIDLHGAAVDLPDIELVTPGPLPTISATKVKKSSGGLCASCFGKKSAENVKKKKSIPQPIPLPSEPAKPIDKEEQKDLSPITEVPSVPSTTAEEPILPRVNIDQFRERNLEKNGQPSTQPQNQQATTVIDSPQPVFSSEPTPVPVKDTSIFSQVNIDQFKERSFQKSSENLPRPQEHVETTVTSTPPPIVEEIVHQLPIDKSISPTSSTPRSVSPTVKDGNIFSQVNIDTFRERTFEKSSENLVKSEENLDTVTPTEPLYQSPISSSPSADASVQPIVQDTSVFSQVNIDTFKERTLQKSSESLPKPKEPSEFTDEIVTALPPPSEEPHYQLPTNEPITPPFPTSQSLEQISKDTSIYSQVNIDTFRDRTLIKHSETTPKREEPHYELPSNEPVPTRSLPLENAHASSEYNPYDTPRTIELEQAIKTEEKIIKHDEMTPLTAASDIQKSSGDFISTETTKVLPKTETVQVKEKKIKKKKSKEPKVKSESKSHVFSSLFCHRQRTPTVPALDLPAVERDLSPNNPVRPPHRHDSDPLHVPSIGLPKLNLPLPDYERPEVDMKTGFIEQSSEFTIPVIDFPPIANLSLPENSKQSIHVSNEEQMRVPQVRLPDLQFTYAKEKNVQSKIKTEPSIETGLALSSPIDDLLSIQTDHKNFPIETDYAVKTETINSILSTQITTISHPSPDQQITVIDTHYVQSSDVPLSVVKQTAAAPQLDFQLPPAEPVPTLSNISKTKPPSFDDDVRSPPSKIVPAVPPSEKSIIEPKPEMKKKSAGSSFCSCFGDKSSASKGKGQIITAPRASLPSIDLPVPASNISSTLKSKGPLRAPGNDLPPVDFTGQSLASTRLPSIHLPEKQGQTNDAVVPSVEVKTLSSSHPAAEQKIKSEISPSLSGKQAIEEIQVVSIKKSSPFDIKAPVIDIPQINVPIPTISLSHQTATSFETIQSHSESVTSSQIQPSSTFGTHTTLKDIQQLPSVSSGFGSGILDSMTTKGYSLPDIQLPEPTLVPKHSNKYDFSRPINVDHDIRTKFTSRRNEIQISLASEIPKSLDGQTDSSSLNQILTESIDLIQEKKVSTYSELHDKLAHEHKQQSHLINPVVHSLYYIIENHGLDNLDKPEFSLTIRDMVRLPAKQTSDTATHFNKESASLSTTLMTKETLPETARSCLTCGRTKSKSKPSVLISTSGTDFLDERRRTQLTTHRTELTNILRDHIQLSQPAIRQFAEHPKEVEKILRKTLTSLTHPKTVSYEQIRHDLKSEFKQNYYLIDPIVDITRDTLDHCDITQMNERINLDILDSNITQTAHIYNQQTYLLSTDEQKALQSNQLSWLETYLINNESKEKKLTRKQSKELKKILHRTLEILSTNFISTWDELALQLTREYPKAHDLCQRSIELIKQSQKDGLFHLQQAPTHEKRRHSSLITEHARQNLKSNRNQIISSFKIFWKKHHPSSMDDEQLNVYLNKIFHHLEEQKAGQLKSYQDLKGQMKKDFPQLDHQNYLEQIIDIIEQAHASNQFDDVEKPEVQTLMKDRLDGKPLIIKEMYVSLPPRIGTYADDSLRYSSVTTNGDRTTTSHRIARGLSWREANERARILFYRGKHPAIHYDEQAAAFDVRMLLETASGGTQEIPVTDSDVHELLNSCGVQWDGVNIISLVDHSEDVVRAAEQAALKVIREKGLVDIRTSNNNNDEINSSNNNELTN